MNISLGRIYDVLITEIGVLTIPREDHYEIRNLSNISKKTMFTSSRDTSGTNIGALYKANALFKIDIYTEHKPSIKDLVENGTIEANGGAQGAAIQMLSLLSLRKLKDEASYLKKVLDYSIIYRVAVNEGVEVLNKTLECQKDSEIEQIGDIVHEKYENEYISVQTHIYERLTNILQKMVAEKNENLLGQTGRISLPELLTICVAICISELTINATKNKRGIEEKQEEVKLYIGEMTACSKSNNIDPIIKSYFLKLWDECSLLSIRDRGDERTQIEKYIYPHFSINKEKRDSPLLFEKGKNIKRILIAESGLGKSSYLDMVTSISIYRDVCEDVSVDENNKKKIGELEKKLGLTEMIMPVLVRAGEYLCDDEGLNGLLSCIIGDPTEEDYIFWIEKIRCAQDRRIVVLVDAIDEIDYNKRAIFLKALNSFMEKVENACLIVTCRPIDRSFFERNRLFRGIEEWRLEPFDREQMTEFIAAKIKADTRGANKDVDKLLDGIVENDYLKGLAPNPYMLEKMLVHDYSTGDNSAYSTIKFLVSNLISRRWDKLFEEYPQIDIDDFSVILAGIAYKMLTNRRNIVERVDLVNDFMTMAKQAGLEDKFPENMFREIVSRMNNAAGLLIYENDGYKYQYPIFAQYLSAKWIYDQIKYIGKNTKTQDVNVMEELLPTCIVDDEWSNTVTMLFTIICESEPRNEFLSTILFRKMLCMGMGSEKEECKIQINNVFTSVKERKFGNNNVAFDKEQKISIETYNKAVKKQEE